MTCIFDFSMVFYLKKSIVDIQSVNSLNTHPDHDDSEFVL